MKIGILREGKIPSDSRVPLSPSQCAEMRSGERGINLVIQPSPHRCFSDSEYQNLDVPIQEDLSDCDVLLGVKEVPIEDLLDHKTYFFFSHTIKKQAYNRKLLQAVLQKRIRLVDWETLTDDKGMRVIAFGRWAGIVGAHNGLWAWGERTGLYHLKRAFQAKDFEELKSLYKNLNLPHMRIAVSGGGRVAHGAMEVLNAIGVRKLSPRRYLEEEYAEPVYVQLDVDSLYARKSDSGFDMQQFFKKPALYEGRFKPYTSTTDLFINAIYWDPAAPVFFTVEQMKRPEFRIRVVSDITCDIGGSVPSTLRATTIDDPVYGFDPVSETEKQPFTDGVIDHVTIDNLPNELPRDASTAFGELFMEFVWPEISWMDESPMINRATITHNGELNEPFSYLSDFAQIQ